MFLGAERNGKSDNRCFQSAYMQVFRGGSMQSTAVTRLGLPESVVLTLVSGRVEFDSCLSRRVSSMAGKTLQRADIWANSLTYLSRETLILSHKLGLPSLVVGEGQSFLPSRLVAFSKYSYGSLNTCELDSDRAAVWKNVSAPELRRNSIVL